MTHSPLFRTATAAAIALIALGPVAGCARNVGANSYDANRVGTTIQTYRGTVQSVRAVTFNNGDELSDNETGILAGGVLGGAAGARFGDGWGRVLAIGIGAVAGAAAGALAESELKEQDGLEVVVLLDDERLLTVLQGPDEPLTPGDRVFVTLGDGGQRARVFRGA